MPGSLDPDSYEPWRFEYVFDRERDIDPERDDEPGEKSLFDETETKVGGPQAGSEAAHLRTLHAWEHRKRANPFEGATKISGPKGSNPAQWYRRPDGSVFLHKQAPDARHAYNEVAAASLYRLAGLRVPTVVLAADQHGYGVISDKVPDLTFHSPESWPQHPEWQQAARAGFGMDALTSNWDVFGLTADNVGIDPQGQVWRIDAGGALSYRAMGGDKPSFAPGQAWTEPETMRTKRQGTYLYGAMSDEEAAASLDAARRVDLQQVAAVWRDEGIPEQTFRPWLETLAARQAQIPAIVAKLRPSFTPTPGRRSATLQKLGANRHPPR